MRVFSLAPVNNNWKSLQDQLPDAFHSFRVAGGALERKHVCCLSWSAVSDVDASSNMRLEAGVEARCSCDSEDVWQRVEVLSEGE